MQKEKQNFDHFFREKLSEYVVTDKPSNWKLLNHLLNDQARKKKKKFIFLLSLMSITLVSSSLFFYGSLTDSSLKKARLTSDLGTEKVNTSSITNTPKASKSSVEDIENKMTSDLGSEERKGQVKKPVFHLVNFEKAIENPSKYNLNLSSPILNKVSPSPKSRFLNFNFQVGLQVEGTDKNLMDYKISKIGANLNSDFSDFSPVISADGSTLFFTSRRPISEKEIRKHKAAKENIYQAAYNSKTKKWSKPVRLNNLVNSPGRHNSVIALAKDGNAMLLYRDDNYGNGDIFQSTLEGTDWTKPMILPEPINSQHHESSAGFSPDGRTIYFCSNRPGGFGGKDIWQSTKDENGNWIEAINMGETINTSFDEEGIFIKPDGKTIYFSSKGHNSFGGYDIYKSVVDKEGKWTTPLNLGQSINSSQDDIYFITDSKGEIGYIASSKNEGSGEMDLYKIIITPSKSENVQQNSSAITLNYLISDQSGENLTEASIELVNNDDNETISKFSSNNLSGKYFLSLPVEINYGVFVHSKGYLFHSENFKVSEAYTLQPISKVIQLKKVEVGNKIYLNNTYFETNKMNVLKESYAELQRLIVLMKEYPAMVIEITNFTAISESQKASKDLPQARAQAIVNYMINNGISENRLRAKGRVDSQLDSQQITKTEVKILAK